MRAAGDNVSLAALSAKMNRTNLHKLLVNYGLRKKRRGKNRGGNDLWNSLRG